jgi:hypothetical protein
MSLKILSGYYCATYIRTIMTCEARKLLIEE